MGYRGKQSLLRINALVAGQCHRCKAVSADSAGVADRERFSWLIMRPTMEVETVNFWSRRSTASLSLRQRGNCNRNCKTFL